ncbi:MAG: hypothetical protein ACR2G4_02955 [Pyrinomonadaceae bacterium]
MKQPGRSDIRRLAQIVISPACEQRLRQRLPTKADRVLDRLREMRGGRLNSSELGERMRGQGKYWRMIEQVFRLHCERNNFNRQHRSFRRQPALRIFLRPCAQGSFFE